MSPTEGTDIWAPASVECPKHGRQPKTHMESGGAYSTRFSLVVCSRCLCEAIAKACPDSAVFTEIEPEEKT